MLFFKTKTIGNFGENEAEKFLRKNGYKILERNYETKLGEIDIIAQKDDYICFIEVKTRSNENYGTPRDAVNYHKQKKIISVAKYYMLTKNKDMFLRFDVIEVVVNKDKTKVEKIEHIEDAFWC